jgi:hypothetical protein
VGSPFTDTTSGTPDATVLAAASALLDPTNNDNLGRTTVGLVATPPAANTLAVNLTMTASAATPLGVYTIGASAGGVSNATDDVFNDYDMSGPVYTVTVGQTLNVVVVGTGTVTSTPGLINCPGVCSDIFPGTSVTLTATPAGTATFTGWSGGSPACSGAVPTCVVTVDVAQTVTATFSVAPQTLTVATAGTGTGTVTSAPAGISCPVTCSAPFTPPTVVTLTAAPTGGSSFTGWSGDCTGTGTCVVTMNVPHSVTATFGPPTFILTVTKAGNGAAAGTVTSSPAGINCGATCSFGYVSGTVVTLTAAAPGAPGVVFTGWSGGSPACSGTGTCVVTVTAAQTVTATFADATAPTTTLISTPTDPSNVPNPTFTFSSNEPGTFQCTLDGGAPFACTSPTTVNVGNGSHTFTVQAFDTAGNPGNIVSFTWVVAGIVVVIAPIPTLNEWMLVLLGLLVGSAGIVLARRRKA